MCACACACARGVCVSGEVSLLSNLHSITPDRDSSLLQQLLSGAGLLPVEEEEEEVEERMEARAWAHTEGVALQE